MQILTTAPAYLVAIKAPGEDSQKPPLDVPVWCVHRLDRDTAGLIVYATSAEGAAEISREIAGGRMKKTYLCVVSGEVPEAGEMVDHLYHDVRRNKSYASPKPRRGTKEARLRYTTLARGMWQETPVALVRVELETGRTHQIRVQFASRTFPLAGDRTYGGMKGKLALFSAEITLFGERYSAVPEAADGTAWAAFRDVLAEMRI